MVDNFDIIIRDLLKFPGEYDRYIVHILKRAKDGNDMGASESSRMIRSYYIDNVDYLLKKKLSIIDLCDHYGARAYICVQPKDNYKCMLNLGQLIMGNLQKGNLNAKPDRLVREAYCGMHQTNLKRWILDLDNDDMDGFTVDQVEKLVKDLQMENGNAKAELIKIPTRNGFHIICTPFNLMKAQAQMPKMFETKGGKQGWIHKDGMTILYCPNLV